MYQQGVQEIKVTVGREIQAENTDGENVDESGANTGENANGDENEEVETSSRAKKRRFRVNLSHTLGVAKELGNTIHNYAIHKSSLENGDQAYANIVDRQMEKLQDVTGTASHIAMGALYGSAGGPVGMALGVAFSSVSSVSSLASKYANRELEFTYKQFKIENGVQYSRARANINLTTGRLR